MGYANENGGVEMEGVLLRLAQIDDLLLLDQHSYGFEERRLLFNRKTTPRPKAICVALTTAAATSAFRLLVLTATPFTIKGSGHNVAGLACREGAVMIDTSLLRRVTFDPDTGIVEVESGALWSDVDGHLRRYGRSVPGGTVSHTGVAGLTLGGGIGWLGTRFGLSCDNLVGIDFVDGTGRPSTATDDDILWAFRGAGRSLGFVTSFRFRTCEIDPVATGFRFSVPRDCVSSAIEPLLECEDLDNGDLSMSPAILWDARQGPTLIVDGLAWKGADALQAWMSGSPLHAAEIEWVGSYYELQRRWDDPLRFGRRNYWKTASVNSLSSRTAVKLLDAAASSPSNLSVITIDLIRGKAAVEPAGGSTTGFRSSPILGLANAIWTSQEDDQSAIDWARSVVNLFGPSDPEQYVNYLDRDDLDARTRERPTSPLLKLKRQLDPDNVLPPLAG